MTGKEALGTLLSVMPFLFQRKDGKSREHNKLFKESLETLETNLELLDKYKRAFEILKEFVSVTNLNGTYLLSVWNNHYTPVCYLDKEQGELLEELMKDGTKNN